MKQEITQNQLMEITKNQSDALLGWMSNRGYYEMGLVHLTIAMMIEFLDEASAKENCDLVIKISGECKNGKRIVNSVYPNNLCDALFEDVKRVLKQNEQSN